MGSEESKEAPAPAATPVSLRVSMFHEAGLTGVWQIEGPTVGQVAAQFAMLLGQEGWHPREPGLEPGEERTPLKGWILGRKRDGEPVVWLYGASLKYNLRIWEEDFDQIPWSITGAPQFNMAMAPDAAEAFQSEYLQRPPAGAQLIYRVRTEVVDNQTKKHFDFVRIELPAGAAPPQQQQPARSKADPRVRTELDGMREFLGGDDPKYREWPEFARWVGKQLGWDQEAKPADLANVTVDQLASLKEAATFQIDGVAAQEAQVGPQDVDIPF